MLWRERCKAHGPHGEPTRWINVLIFIFIIIEMVRISYIYFKFEHIIQFLGIVLFHILTSYNEHLGIEFFEGLGRGIMATMNLNVGDVLVEIF